MANESTIFGLEIGYYDSEAEADAGKEVILATPCLAVFASPGNAVMEREGINIVEGDLLFFAFDGSPMKACFSVEPYINAKEYFPGIYSLLPGIGPSLKDTIAEIIDKNPSPHARIVVRVPATKDSAQQYGWSDMRTMKEGIDQALKILPPDLAKRIVFE